MDIKVSKRCRNKVMRSICRFHYQRDPSTYITYEYLYYHGLSKIKDAEHVINVLQSMGYIKICRTPNSGIECVELTDKGKCYFEVSNDERNAFVFKSILVPVFVSVIANLVIIALKQLL